MIVTGGVTSMAETLYIRAGWLIDGSGGKVKKDMLLIVVDGKIIRMEAFRPDDAPDPRVVTDLSFGTILPPFIDCHVHLAMSGSMDPQIRERQLVAGCEELKPLIVVHLDQHLAHGVMAVRDGGDREDCVARFLCENKDKKHPVRVQTPGRAWHRQGRYGKLIGRCPEIGQTLGEAFGSEGTGSGYVKLVNSGLNSLKIYGRETAPQFSQEEIGELVVLAGKQGRKVMVHANGRQAVRDAVDAGCHSIEHGFFMGKENLQRMAERGCIWVPTACTMKAYAEILEHGKNAADAVIARKNLFHQLDQLYLARELGVTVALGTDAGSPGVLHGEAVFEEMKLFVKAGYSLAETVQSATSVGARLMGLEDMGLLAEGRAANFLVARGTPAQLPRKFSYLEDIYIGGKPSSFYRKNPHKHVRETG